MADAAQLILASASPRRRELLAQLGVVFRVQPAEIDETPHRGELAAAFAQRMAREKAQAAYQCSPAALPILAADTVVGIDQQILGKPRGRADAIEMLQSLSGRSHWVYSALALQSRAGLHEKLCATQVWFKALSPRAINVYWETGEPKDKAGAYGIQGLGGLFVERIDGSYTGVMGLPIFETGQLLAACGILDA
ncbi:septum formation protein [Ectothiorhodosinus mongolicus]|uniref:dTTP/UTP pyrophosphatase n=1 Tax=Ectothiorhodosinus mongolicus TaxID=233100 RepID=A0A1R3VPE2_9GAMM|nr:Maf family protein [Ectothiorhodosinus mongolicus]ULX56594.1 septum formation inhibitor Maf [Ectothiorhodosinus mongolicus]SIT66440.1 septum formation protein [Ectothiorhodosinus mongolicus]